MDVARAADSQASFGYFDHDADVGVFSDDELATIDKVLADLLAPFRKADAEDGWKRMQAWFKKIDKA